MASKYRVYSEYKDSEIEVIGDIPKTWMLGRLKQIVDNNRQITYGIVQAGPNKENGIPYIRPADMTEEGGVKSYEDLLRTSPAIAADYERSKIKPGDIICSIGPSFGKVMITPEVLDGANLTQGTARVAISSNYSSRYFFWALRSTSSFQQWESSVGGATFRALNLGPLADTFVAIPSRDEQEKIASFLDHETAKIDTLIEKQQQLIKLLKEKRQAVISHAVTKGLNPNTPMRDSGVEWLGEVPEHWVVTKSKFLFDFVTSGSRGWAEHYSDEGPLFFRITNLTRDTIEPKLESIQFVSPPVGSEGERSIIKRYDLLISITADLGSVCVANEDLVDGYVSQHVALCRPNKKVKSSRWLGYFILSDQAKEQFIGSGYGGTKIQLSLEDIRELDTVMPPAKEQIEIEIYIDEQLTKFTRLIGRAEDQIQLLQERRTALISAAVTGKIDVRDWRAPAQSKANKEVEA